MNNIIELYDIEFKRIKKTYLLLILGLILCNLFIFVFKVFAYTNVRNFDFIEAINLLKSKVDVNDSFIINITNLFNVVFVIFIFLILIYGIIIWYRDFYFKEKTAYILYLIPQNKMNIFFSKFLVVLNIIYTLTFIQIMICLMCMLFINNVLGYNISLTYFNFPIMFTFKDFFIINILGVVCAISVIFMCTLFSLYNKKIGILSFIILIPISLFLYVYLFEFKGVISISIIHSIYLIFLTGLSFFVSSKLINKIDF